MSSGVGGIPLLAAAEAWPIGVHYATSSSVLLLLGVEISTLPPAAFSWRLAIRAQLFALPRFRDQIILTEDIPLAAHSHGIPCVQFCFSMNAAGEMEQMQLE